MNNELTIPSFLRDRPKVHPAEEVEDTVEVIADPDTLLGTNDLTLHRVYYVLGKMRIVGSKRYHVNDPPHAGYSYAFVIESGSGRKGKGKKTITLFCPYTLQSFFIGEDAGELDSEEDLTNFRAATYSRLITNNWELFCKLGLRRDYDVAALVLTRLGTEVPTITPIVGEDEEEIEVKIGGKLPLDALLKPIDPDTVRGKVATFFLEEDDPRSVREAMAVVGVSRSSLLSHLYTLNKTHGLGYDLIGDTARVVLPKDVEDPFGKVEQAARMSKPVPEGDFPPVPEKGKRRMVYEAFKGKWRSLDDVALEAECSSASVRSHLNDLRTKHGVQSELRKDNSTVEGRIVC